MTKQPVWKLVAQLGDAHPLEYGGYFVYEDTTGVYPPEAVWLEAPETDEGKWTEYRFILEPCTFKEIKDSDTNETVTTILSDNKFHPEHPAWFAKDIAQIAERCGMDASVLINWFTGDDINLRAEAWKAVGERFGFENLDQYPNHFTRSEIEARYPRETWRV